MGTKTKNFKYRIYPTKSQQTKLEKQLSECRWLYNHFLEQRKTSWEEKGKSLSCFGQQATLPQLKKEKPELKIVHYQSFRVHRC